VKHSTGKPTKAEEERLKAIHNMPCVACAQQLMTQPNKTEAHHLVDKGTRKHSGGHMATIPLCSWHHRGEQVYPLTAREMLFLYGPSLAKSKKNFVAQFGRERSLLEITDKQLHKDQAA
jgi:hypothetical protein